MKIRTEKVSDINQITVIHDQAFNGPDEGKIVENIKKEVQKAKELWLQAARADSKPIPMPKYRSVIYQVVSS